MKQDNFQKSFVFHHPKSLFLHNMFYLIEYERNTWD